MNERYINKYINKQINTHIVRCLRGVMLVMMGSARYSNLCPVHTCVPLDSITTIARLRSGAVTGDVRT